MVGQEKMRAYWYKSGEEKDQDKTDDSEGGKDFQKHLITV